MERILEEVRPMSHPEIAAAYAEAIVDAADAELRAKNQREYADRLTADLNHLVSSDQPVRVFATAGDRVVIVRYRRNQNVEVEILPLERDTNAEAHG